MKTAGAQGLVDRLGRSGMILIGVNLLPLLGVILFDWDVFRIMALFWFENLFIGILGILRMCRSGLRSWFAPLFFTVHFGAFMVAHGVVLVELFGPATLGQSITDNLSFLWNTLGHTEIVIVGLAIAASHLWSYLENFVGNQEFLNLSQDKAMTLPYRRVLITHVALIGGGILLEKWGEPLVGLVVLIAVKTAMDWFSHRHEHEQLSRTPPASR